ncbi:MAG: peptidase M14 [Acidobacteria bacterium]|nr:peptidase M14 [Acidobacteriota bacterium]
MKFLHTLFLAALLAAAAPVTPESHFGHRMGADYKVLDWDKVVSYFGALEKSSDRIRVREYGKTAEGRPMIYAVIAAPETLKNLPRYQQIQKKLVDPRLTPVQEAEKLIADGKTVVLVTCTIHATEIASTHTAVEYAYKLATATDPKSLAILNNTIVLLVPSLNPDGLDIVTKWYRGTLNTPFEGTSPPELYQKYTGHDNNRDWYIFSQPETRATVTQLHNAWHPQIVYDVHQQGSNASRMFVPPWLDPVDPNIDPIITQWCNALGTGMAADMTAAGLKGIAINASYDFWTPARHYQSYHGGMRILSESASARIASPINIRPGDLRGEAIGYSPSKSSWNHLEVWPGGTWRLRDIVDYQIVAFDSLLYQAAIRRTDLLWSFYRINDRSAKRMEPYAFIVPAQQADPAATTQLLKTLAFGAVEIDIAKSTFSADGRQYNAGDYIVRLQQPFSGFAKTLLEKQEYPDIRQYPGGPPRRPYDVTAQTLPMLMGVKVDTIKDSFATRADRAANFDLPGSNLTASDSNSYKAIAQAWKQGRKVYRDTTTGAFFYQPGTGRRELAQPRIGLYKSPSPIMDEGWTRWLFDNFGWTYTSLTNQEIRAGNLRGKYDAILFPDQTAASIRQGYFAGSMPDEYTGGLAEPGAAALRAFAEQGGNLIFLNKSSAYAASQLNIAAENLLQSVPPRDFYCPGSLLNVGIADGSPLGYGLPKQFTIWAEASPAWDSEYGVVKYAESNVLASGWLLGERFIAGKSALLDIPVGKGRIILFGMRPQYRAQSYLTFKLLFNAILYN